MIEELSNLHSTSAMLGAMIGGGASLAAAIYTQWHQDRLQRISREASKREAIYGEFIMSASKVLVNAYISDSLAWTGDEQHLVGLVNRMRLFAPAQVIAEAEAVMRNLVRIAQQPKLAIEELANSTISSGFAPDLLLTFSLVTQADLERVSRGNRLAMFSYAKAFARKWLLEILSFGAAVMSKIYVPRASAVRIMKHRM